MIARCAAAGGRRAPPASLGPRRANPSGITDGFTVESLTRRSPFRVGGVHDLVEQSRRREKSGQIWPKYRQNPRHALPLPALRRVDLRQRLHGDQASREAGPGGIARARERDGRGPRVRGPARSRAAPLAVSRVPWRGRAARAAQDAEAETDRDVTTRERRVALST